MTLSEEIKWRGFQNQTTYPDLSVIDNQKIIFYHGFDASAYSQTVGNLAGMMLDRLFLKHGHKGVILAGGATSLIGDPGGKDEERPLQDEETIARNISNTENQLKRVLQGYDFELVNNLDWTKHLSVIDFLRYYGKHFSMTPLIQRDYISKRLGENSVGISYAEFSYTILQGMDYLRLFEDKGVTLQLGGSDQWGNCISGVDLIRKVHSKDAHVLTLPLIINKATGKKFGKSEEGAIWLDAGKTSVFDFYQFWINVDDTGVEDFLKVYTELDKEHIDQVMEEFRQNPSERKAQQVLAYEATCIVHGEEAALKAQHETQTLKSDISSNESVRVQVQSGSSLVEALVKSELAASNSEARRLIEEGGIYVNNEASENDMQLNAHEFQNNRLILRRGKKLQNTRVIELV
jgi:tyrosyl-tRNA synthetase